MTMQPSRLSFESLGSARPAAQRGADAAGQAASSGWVIELHDGLADIAQDWRRLEDAGAATVFQCLDWLSVWYDIAARHGIAEPVIVTGRRRGARQVEIILPLCRLRRHGLSVLTFPDIMTADFAAPVFAPAAFLRPDAIAGFWRALRQALRDRLPGDHAIHLAKITADVGPHRNPLMALPGLSRMPYRLWGLPLDPAGSPPCPSIPAATLASTEKRRAQLGRKVRRTVSWCEDSTALGDQFDELAAMRTVRCETIGRDEILLQPAWAEFYRALATRPHGTMTAAVTRLQADGETIATLFGVGYRGAFHYLMPTYLMKTWSRYTPGFQLLLEAIEASAARGYGYFDLTIGDEPYKQKFGAEARLLYESFTPLTATGWLLKAMWLAKVWMRAGVYAWRRHAAKRSAASRQS